MEHNIVLPELNYTLLVELTTNIEDYIFMEIKNVQVALKGTTVISKNGTGSPKYFSSQENSENDRVEIDFGYVTVSFSFYSKYEINI